MQSKSEIVAQATTWRNPDYRCNNHLRYTDDTILTAESEKELKSLLRVKEESEKAGLKLNIEQTKIMTGKVEAGTDFIFLGSKITVESDHSHEIRRCLLFGRKTVTNLDSILKSRDITLPTNVQTVKL